MNKTKILIPLDPSERSTHSISWIKKYFDKNYVNKKAGNLKNI